MAQNENVITVKDLSKTFKLPKEQVSGLKQAILNIFRTPARRVLGYDVQQVLNDVSFTVKKGEFFGIVGRNGSGKSTLLKLLAGIYAPDSGLVKVEGSLTPFIELGVGFNPELTGRENIYLNGALLGFSRMEVDAMYDDIVEFAELAHFMDQKLKNYSSGMQVRLAFSIAVRAESDILLFDEVLAVGDAAFQQKCYDMFSEIKRKGTTIVLVTHDMSAVQRFCDRAILVHEGKIILDGDPLDVADHYLEENYERSAKAAKRRAKAGADDDEDNDAGMVKNVKINHSGRTFNIGEKIHLSFDVETEGRDKYQIGFQIFRQDGVYAYGTNSSNAAVGPFTGSKHLEIAFDHDLAPGGYYVTLAFMDPKAENVLRYQPKVAQFNIKQQTKRQGVVLIDEQWEVI